MLSSSGRQTHSPQQLPAALYKYFLFWKWERFAGFYVEINIFPIFDFIFEFLRIFTCTNIHVCTVHLWKGVFRLQISILNFAGYFVRIRPEGCSPSGSRMKKPLLQYSGQQPFNLTTFMRMQTW